MVEVQADRDRHELDLLLRGFQVSRILRLVADLGVADKIPAEGSLSIRDLASSCAVLPQPLTRVLRVLAAFKIFEVTASGSISHTPRSRLLRSDTPNSFHHSARFWTGPGSWASWGKLDAAMTGSIPHEAAWGKGRFDYLRQSPDEARAFDAMMANFPDNRHAAIAAAYDFSQATLIADVGGGNGAALRQILARFPNARGVLLDRSDVVNALSSDLLLNGRIDAIGASFFDRVPEGADVYLLIRVLHDWDDDDCVRILKTCQAAMKDGSRLLLGEEILQPDPLKGEVTSYLIDTQMMAMFGKARMRSEDEFRELFDRSGLSMRQVIRTSAPVSIVEAVRT